MPLDIHHDERHSRFHTRLEGHEAELVYRRSGQQLVIEHTGVPAAIGGRGVAAELMRAVLDYVSAEGLKAVPACSYAVAYFQRHPGYAHLLA